MLITKAYQMGLTMACKEINKTGLSNLVFSVQAVGMGNITIAIFKDSSYPQACHICERLNIPKPTLKEWVGE